jgi:hypothetical protein
MGAENLVPTGIRSPNFSARNESLYRLRCLPRLKRLYQTFHISHFFSVPHLSHSHLCNGPNNIWGRTQTCEEHLYANLFHHVLLLVFSGQITLTAHSSDSLNIIPLRKKRSMSWYSHGDGILSSFLGQTAVSRYWNFPTFRELTPFPKRWKSFNILTRLSARENFIEGRLSFTPIQFTSLDGRPKKIFSNKRRKMFVI